MSRVHVINGILSRGYEPHDMPGAYIVMRHQVYQEKGEGKSSGNYEGPGWIDRHPTNPERRILVIGKADSTQLRDYEMDAEPLPESLVYDAAYRKGWAGKRKPRLTLDMDTATVDGLLDGWRARVAAKG